MRVLPLAGQRRLPISAANGAGYLAMRGNPLSNASNPLTIACSRRILEKDPRTQIHPPWIVISSPKLVC